MEGILVPTSDLIGAELDWAVAKAAGKSVIVLLYDNPQERWQVQRAGYPFGPFWPSQDWGQCGPLIEKYKIGFSIDGDDFLAVPTSGITDVAVGPNHLVAACRAVVTNLMGRVVLIPSDLRP